MILWRCLWLHGVKLGRSVIRGWSCHSFKLSALSRFREPQQFPHTSSSQLCLPVPFSYWGNCYLQAHVVSWPEYLIFLERVLARTEFFFSCISSVIHFTMLWQHFQGGLRPEQAAGRGNTCAWYCHWEWEPALKCHWNLEEASTTFLAGWLYKMVQTSHWNEVGTVTSNTNVPALKMCVCKTHSNALESLVAAWSAAGSSEHKVFQRGSGNKLAVLLSPVFRLAGDLVFYLTSAIKTTPDFWVLSVMEMYRDWHYSCGSW